jgi:hypothetical protein
MVDSKPGKATTPMRKPAAAKPAAKAPAAAAPPALQPTAERAIALLSPGPDDTLLLDAAGADAIGRELAGFFGKRELVAVVQDLVSLAYYLAEKRSSPEAGRAIVKQLHAAIPHLEKLGVDIEKLINKDAVEDSGKFAAMKSALGDKGRAADPRMEKHPDGPSGVFGLLSKKK